MRQNNTATVNGKLYKAYQEVGIACSQQASAFIVWRLMFQHRYELGDNLYDLGVEGRIIIT